MRTLIACALLVATAACAQAAPRAAGLAQPGSDGSDAVAQPAVQHHGDWMRRPFSFDASFEGDGSCEVHRNGDGHGTLRGSESCEKNVRGRMDLERERGEGGGDAPRVSARSRDALGAALATRLGGADVPAGLVESAVTGAFADVEPSELDAALQAGGSLEIKAKAKYSFECSIRKRDEADGRGGQGDDDGGHIKAEVHCTLSKEKSGSARCSRRDEDDSSDAIAQLRQRTAAYAWRLAHGG